MTLDDLKSPSQFLIPKIDEVSVVSGAYIFRYTVYDANRPKISASVDFEILISSSCLSSAKITSSGPFAIQEYTIGQPKKTFSFAKFTSDPAICNITYTYSVQDPAIQSVVLFDNYTQQFDFRDSFSIGLASEQPPFYKDYAINLTASVS